MRVVERLEVDRVEVWEAKDDRNEGDPEHHGDRDWVQALAEAEGFSIDPRRWSVGRWAVLRWVN
jgi:hypothetical protein